MILRRQRENSYAPRRFSVAWSQQTDRAAILRNPGVTASMSPWPAHGHRTLIVRALKGLEAVIPVSIVEPVMTRQGWAFSPALPDHANGFAHLHQLYTAALPGYTGRVTVPVLWDTTTRTIVSNESADIVRMLNTAFRR